MQTHWFYTVWPFIGLGGAVVMVAILLHDRHIPWQHHGIALARSCLAGVASRAALLAASA